MNLPVINGHAAHLKWLAAILGIVLAVIAISILFYAGPTTAQRGGPRMPDASYHCRASAGPA